jgi:hypothetical protein
MNRSIQREIQSITKQAGGATLTKVARATALAHVFDVWRNALNLQVKSLSTVKTAHIAAYARHAIEAGKSLRSIQNDLAHVRAGLRALGREQFAASPTLSNAAMGVSGASRDGTHRALSQEQYAQALSAAQAHDAGFAALVQLQRELGLRAREAVQSIESLKRWEKALERGERVRVLHGTKGGRPRETGACDSVRALAAVRAALAVVKERGLLMPSQSLQGAMRMYGRHCEHIGLTGEHASHALRCMYAQERFAQHLDACDGNRNEALAETSLDLGHGDGRGTYVAQVYLR